LRMCSWPHFRPRLKLVGVAVTGVPSAGDRPMVTVDLA